MSDGLQLIVTADGVTIFHPLPERRVTFKIGEEAALGERLAEYCVTRGVSGNAVTVLLGEELLFYKTVRLPANTQDVKEALGYQMGMLVPFEEEDILFSYVAERSKEFYRIILIAANKSQVEPFLREIVGADFIITGLYPEFMRFVTKAVPKGRWGLLAPGKVRHVLVFEGQQLLERLLFRSEPPHGELVELCHTEQLYRQDPPAESPFEDSAQLLTERAVFKEFNMLPADYRQPEFTKFFIILLLVFNLIALGAFVGGKEYQLRSLAAKVDHEISAIRPQLAELKKLHREEQELIGYVEEIKGLGRNPDLIGFITKLTAELPMTAYLDQMRLDGKQHAVHIQGFTADIGELTAKLQAMGDAKLKSTSRRKDRTYFNIEISLP